MRNIASNAARPARPLLAALLLLACTATPDDAYRLAVGGGAWQEMRESPLARQLMAAYPEFFAVVMDADADHDPDLRPLRDDLEADPPGPHSYRALNAVAFAYFELNYRAQSDRGGDHYLSNSFRAAKVLAVPWRAYGEVGETGLRDAILDFFEDAASGRKEESATTAPRLMRVVQSLEKKEDDPERLARIEAIVGRLATLTEPLPLE